MEVPRVDYSSRKGEEKKKEKKNQQLPSGKEEHNQYTWEQHGYMT